MKSRVKVDDTAAPYSCWVVTDGRRGIENQALGLAEAVAKHLPLRILTKRIHVKSPWRKLPRALWGDPFSRLSPGASLLRPPFPPLWIGCGRLSTPYAAAVKKRAPETFVVQLQNPRTNLAPFDLVTPPLHDRVKGENVFAIVGSPNRVSAERLHEDGDRLTPALSYLPRPRIAVLLGGANRAYQLSPRRSAEIAEALRSLAESGAGLMVTGSRRTPPHLFFAVRCALKGIPHFLWDGAPIADLSNPYFGLLGMADHVLVTEDSVNMATEAAATGKPVHILPLDQAPFALSNRKFGCFHKSLREHGVSRPYRGVLEEWRYPPFNETETAAREVARRFLCALTNRGEIELGAQ